MENSLANVGSEDKDCEPELQAQANGDWDGLAATFAKDAKALEAAGAEAIVICANTMHLVAPQVQAAITVPVIHMLDVTATAIKEAGDGHITEKGDAKEGPNCKKKA